MRLFIAITPPTEFVNEFKRLQRYLPESRFAKNFHLTLKFLGESDSASVRKSLSKVKFEEFHITLDAVGGFPSLKKARVIWVGLKKSQKLALLKSRIDQVLPEFSSDFAYHPHFTLARLNKPIDCSSLAQIPVRQYSFKVASFDLYSSVLTPKGPIHARIGSFQQKYI